MKPDALKSIIERTADALRAIALVEPDGTLLGGEDDMLNRLGVSRITVRQAARLLEREGVLRVRRGLNGGYFAARPTIEMVETIVCGYLNTMGLDARHSGTVTAALWIEALGQAAEADRAAATELAERFSRRIEAVADNATIEDISKVELDVRSAVLELIGGAYIEVLIRINVAFSRARVQTFLQSVHVPDYHDEPWHLAFVSRWKKAKLMELQAIADGDPVMAVMAGRHARSVWNQRQKRAVAPGGGTYPAIT